MSFKGILLDIDNTIYDYPSTHRNAMDAVRVHLGKILGKENAVLDEAYRRARESVHIELAGTAASHSRLLYFQRMLERLGANPLVHAMDCYDLYWDRFLSGIQTNEGVYAFLEQVKEARLCLLTDLTAPIQFRKIRKLRLDEYTSRIVTSEEAGHEKPHPYIFLLGLRKIGVTPEQACMIGDSYENDIFGALNVGIKPFWFCPGSVPASPLDKRVTVFRSFTELAGMIR